MNMQNYGKHGQLKRTCAAIMTSAIKLLRSPYNLGIVMLLYQIAFVKCDLQPHLNDWEGTPKPTNMDDMIDSSAVENNSKTAFKMTADVGFIHAFIASLSVIVVSELGDKTFFIAAIMAMRHPRITVFIGAIAALGLMTVLSAVFGMAATIIPRVYTYYISTILFALFGLKMLKEGYYMSPNEGQEELEEVQSDLRKREDELLKSLSENRTQSDRQADIDFGQIDVRNVKLNNSSSMINLNGNTMRQLNNHTSLPSSMTSSTASLTLASKQSNKSIGQSPPASVMTSCTSRHRMSVTSMQSTTLLNSTQRSQSQMQQQQQMVQHQQPQKQSMSGDDNLNLMALNKMDADNSNSKSSNVSTKGGSSNSSSNALNNTSLHNSTEMMGSGGVVPNRLERETTSMLVQDPESGVIRKTKNRASSYVLSRILMQAFTMTFLAEWGDRSQLTTIILSARENVYGVIVGGVLGHSICTGLAVVGGRMIAQKISIRTVTLVGGVVFLLFALSALFFNPNDEELPKPL